MQYDTASRNLVFNISALIALVAVILLTAYLLHNAAAVYKNSKKNDLVIPNTLLETRGRLRALKSLKTIVPIWVIFHT